MLVDQIRILTNEIPGKIEKIIYEIQFLAVSGIHHFESVVFSGEEEIVKYFTEEGFTVKTHKDIDSGGTVITISW
jgi:hypothetical protein